MDFLNPGVKDQTSQCGEVPSQTAGTHTTTNNSHLAWRIIWGKMREKGHLGVGTPGAGHLCSSLLFTAGLRANEGDQEAPRQALPGLLPLMADSHLWLLLKLEWRASIGLASQLAHAPYLG